MNKIIASSNFSGGIAESLKIGLPNSFNFSQNLNIYDEPTQLTLLPATANYSGTTVTGLVKWFVIGQPYDTKIYAYDENGSIYSITSGGVCTFLRKVANSSGQGFDLLNDYIYYSQDSQIGRYGPLSTTPTFTDNWQTGLTTTSTTKFAPAKAFKEGMAFGFGNNLAWWDGSVFNATKIVLPPGIQIRCLDVVDEFLVMGTWTGTTITDSEKGYCFFWDGTATSFNFFVEMPEGGVNALVNSRNRLFSIIGSSGYLYLNYAPFQKVHKIPNVAVGNYVEVYPGAVTNWKGITHFGASANTDSTTIVNGVYQWGAKSDRFPDVMNFAYGISTGNTLGSNVKIGALKGDGNQLFIGWEDTTTSPTTYGIDRVLQTNSPATSGYIQSLIFDDNRIYQEKMTEIVKATHKPLRTGESVQLGYDLDRSGTFTLGTANTTVGSKETRLTVSKNARFTEAQVKLLLGATGTTSPVVTSWAMQYDDLQQEERI